MHLKSGMVAAACLMSACAIFSSTSCAEKSQSRNEVRSIGVAPGPKMNYVYMTGAGRPGVYQMPENGLMLRNLTVSSGASEDTRWTVAEVKRTEAGKTKVFTSVTREEMFAPVSMDVPLIADDLVTYK